MPIFTKESLETLPAYQEASKAALRQIGNKPLQFVYSEKHGFKFPRASAAPLFVCEKDAIKPDMLKAIKDAAGATPAEGFCYYNDDGALVLRVGKGKLTEGGFKVKGVDKVVIAKSADAGAIAQDKNVDGNPVALNKSKLDQFKDVVKRQEAKLTAARQRLTEIDQKNRELAETLKQMKANPPQQGAAKQEVETYKKLLEDANTAKLALSQEKAS